MRLIFLSVISLLLLAPSLRAQPADDEEETNTLVQFSGVIVSADSLRPLAFTNISITNTYRGTSSDFFGFFSFVAEKGDIIEFSAVGYKKSFFKIPDSLTGTRYSLIQMMNRDTIWLTETVIYPWPTPDQFKQAFVNTSPPDDDYDRALKNLALAELREQASYMPMDASMNYRNYIEKTTNRLYYAGQLPPNNLLNPLAWSKFLKAWRDGDFKKQKSETEYYYNDPLE